MPTWATGWATGDIVTAAEFRKGVGSIYDTTLGVAAASIDVTSIIANYAHLLIDVYARGDTAASFVNVDVRLNNDTAADYDFEVMNAGGTTVNATENFGQTYAFAGYAPAASAPANLFSAFTILIPHYANNANNKNLLTTSSLKVGVAAGNMSVLVIGGYWRSNAAVNRVTIFPAAGNFAAGTRLTIYGMGA